MEIRSSLLQHQQIQNASCTLNLVAKIHPLLTTSLRFLLCLCRDIVGRLSLGSKNCAFIQLDLLILLSLKQTECAAAGPQITAGGNQLGAAALGLASFQLLKAEALRRDRRAKQAPVAKQHLVTVLFQHLLTRKVTQMLCAHVISPAACPWYNLPFAEAYSNKSPTTCLTRSQEHEGHGAILPVLTRQEIEN